MHLPAIAIGGGEGHPGLEIRSFKLKPGEDQIVAKQLRKVLGDHLYSAP